MQTNGTADREDALASSSIYLFYLMARDAGLRSIRGVLQYTKETSYGSQRRQEVRASGLFVYGDVGEILQRGV
jgi:hypothetical protein